MKKTDDVTEPDWPTPMRGRFPDGRCLGIDKSVWLYKAVPLGPVDDAIDSRAMLAMARPLNAALASLEPLAQVRVARRSASKDTYREVHMLLVNIPRRFAPGPKQPLADHLVEQFPDKQVEQRLLLFGVKLLPRLGNGGWKSAIDSVAETIAVGGAPMSDYDRDFAVVDQALSRAGLTTPTDADFRLANAWWNSGLFSDTPQLVHSDHLHIFASPHSMMEAAALEEQQVNCHKWPPLAKHHTLALASIQDFDFVERSATSSGIHWASELVEAGAVGVSVRGKVEPAKVTRAELRRNRKRYLDDTREAQQNRKMDRAEVEEKLQGLSTVESVYATQGLPTLTQTSVIAAFTGKDARGSYDVTDHVDNSVLGSMVSRQDKALTEMMICSPMRANPHRHDLSTSTVAASGLPSLSVAGDASGALLGFTERDSQPTYVSPDAASVADGLPMMLVAGATGSGKDIALSTTIEIPSGTTRFGDLRVGDRVFDRHGKPCNVTFLSDVKEKPDLYRITFDTGQTIEADADHQWIASSFYDRAAPNRPKHKLAIEKYRQAQAAIDTLIAESSGVGDGSEWDVREIHGVTTELGLGDFFPSPEACRASLLFVDCDPHEVERTVSSVPLRERGAVLPRTFRAKLGELARGYGLPGVRTREVCTATLDDTPRSFTRPVQVWPASVALKSLALRLSQRYADKPSAEAGEVVISTLEMIAAGITAPGLQSAPSNWAMRVPGPLDLPDAALPVDPWLMGAWLGDGSSNAGVVWSGDADIAEMEPRLRVAIGAGSECILNTGSRGRAWGVRSTALTTGLREAGVFGQKHVPDLYLRASFEQRLAVLQGLMDTDGTISTAGACELGLSDERLAGDALRLIRSLGIKASVTTGAAGYRDDDGRWARCKDRHRIHFTTDLPVFRMARKAERLPTRVRETQKWLYVTSIERVDPAPARCITVDSPDSSYLVAEGIPSHNTQALLWLADQFARMGSPNVVIDPKQGSDHTEAIEASPNGQVASLDDLIMADGIFDPLRFSASPEVAVETAAGQLLRVNPWGTNAADYEQPLTHALAYGVGEGATCIGEALVMADNEHKVPPDLVKRVMDQTESSPMFRAFVGRNPGTNALRVQDGITLIKVGNAHLDLPEPGSQGETLPQRIALALVRMMVFGSSMALTGRRGVLHLDEAWVMLSSGRAEVEKMGRLARSQEVLPILYTQRVTDALKAELAGYISRGLILHVKDEAEARAACELFKLEPTAERLERIMAEATVAGGADENGAPNWDSFRALRDPDTGAVLRGSIGIYKDLSGRAVPTEIILPPSFLAKSSTNTADVRDRKARLATAAAALAEQEQWNGLDSAGDGVEDMFVDDDLPAEPVGAVPAPDVPDLLEGWE